MSENEVVEKWTEEFSITKKEKKLIAQMWESMEEWNLPRNTHRVIFWKRTTCNNLYIDAEKCSEFAKLVRHQSGEKSELQFFEAFDIILSENQSNDPKPEGVKEPSERSRSPSNQS